MTAERKENAVMNVMDTTGVNIPTNVRDTVAQLENPGVI